MVFAQTNKVAALLRSLGSAGFLFAARASVVIYQLQFAEHQFGPSYGGLIALLNQITFYILLAELGLASATTSLLFEPVHQGDRTRTKALIIALQADVQRILYWMAPLSCVAVTGLSFWLRKQMPMPVLAPSLLLTSVAALLTFVALPYQSHFNASDRVPTRNYILGCGFIGKVLLGVVLAKSMHSFVGLPLGTAIVGVIELVIQRLLVMPHLGNDPVSMELVLSARSSIRERAKFVLFHRVGYLFAYQSDYIILLLSSSLSLLGYYAQYQYIYAGLLSFSLAVGATLTARIARRQLTVGKENFPSLYRTTSALAGAAAAFCGVGFYLFVRPLIGALYHSDRVHENVVILFAIMLILNILKINDDIWIDTTGTYGVGYYLPILEAATYVALGLFLVTHLQMAGILYAGIVTNILFSIIGKSVVIGRGVMKQQIRSTALVKVLNLAAVAFVFWAVILMMRIVERPVGSLVQNLLNGRTN